MDFRRRRKIEAHIDMTPMIDTLLQLFMIFLLSASFVASAVRLELPKAAARQQAATEPVVVSLDADNRLYLNQEPIAVDSLREKLAAAFRKAKKSDAVFRADQSLSYKHILAVIANMKQAGAENIDLAYDEDKGR